MKELLDLINDMKYEYPEYDELIEDILDECLSRIEEGGDKQEAIQWANESLNDLREFDK